MARPSATDIDTRIDVGHAAISTQRTSSFLRKLFSRYGGVLRASRRGNFGPRTRFQMPSAETRKRELPYGDIWSENAAGKAMKSDDDQRPLTTISSAKREGDHGTHSS
jgi:hypothetical protein